MSLCPNCHSELVEQRGKLVCNACHTIVETCCEGGRCTYNSETEIHPDAVARWKQLAKISAENYAAWRNTTYAQKVSG